MTTIEPIDLPVITEDKANEILDDVVHTIITPRDEQGDDITMSTQQKLLSMFGDFSPVVAQMILMGALRGHEVGFVDATPNSDRTDVLAAALRRVHEPEMFGDCVEDGEHFPCRTIRVLDLVAGKTATQDDQTEASAA